MLKRNNNGVFYVVIALVATLAIGFGAYAYSVSQNVNVSGDYNYYEAEGQPSEAPSFGTGIGDRVMLNDIEYGSALSARLDFTAGSTTTPGGLFKILNGREDRLCKAVYLDIDDATSVGGALGTGHPMSFSVTTSTAATTCSDSCVGLMATSTVATSTPVVLSNVLDPGTSVADPDESGHPWKWTAGTYLLGQFDSLSTYAATSSAAYTGFAGKVYVDCIVQ